MTITAAASLIFSALTVPVQAQTLVEWILLNSGCGGQDDEQKDDKLECGSGTEFKIDEDKDDELDKVEIPSKGGEVKEDKVEGCDSLQLIISLEDKYTNTILII